MIPFVWVSSLGNFRFGTFALELALKTFRLETLAWKLSFWGTFAWELSRGNFSLGSLALDLLPGIFRLGTFARELSLAGLDCRFSVHVLGLDFMF